MNRNMASHVLVVTRPHLTFLQTEHTTFATDAGLSRDDAATVVVAGATVDRVDPCTTLEDVVLAAAVELVSPEVAEERVFASVSVERVVAPAAGELLKSRVDLNFVGTAIAQSPTSSLAILAGSGQVAVVDLDSGEVIEQVSENLGAPMAMLSDELAVATRLGGDIELWSADGLASIGPLILADARGRDYRVGVASAGELWYHTSARSIRSAEAALPAGIFPLLPFSTLQRTPPLSRAVVLLIGCPHWRLED